MEMPVLTALSRAFHWQRLTLLSPAVVGALLAGRQPRTLSLIWLKNNEVPRSWDDQERLFGRMDGFDSAPVAGVDREPSPVLAIRARKKPGETPGFLNVGGAEEDRTPDLRIANATLSQLSYRPNGREL